MGLDSPVASPRHLVPPPDLLLLFRQAP